MLDPRYIYINIYGLLDLKLSEEVDINSITAIQYISDFVDTSNDLWRHLPVQGNKPFNLMDGWI